MAVNSESAMNALFVVLAELFDTWLRIITCDASRKSRFVIPRFMTRWFLPKQHSVNVASPLMGEWTRQ